MVQKRQKGAPNPKQIKQCKKVAPSPEKKGERGPKKKGGRGPKNKCKKGAPGPLPCLAIITFQRASST